MKVRFYLTSGIMRTRFMPSVHLEQVLTMLILGGVPVKKVTASLPGFDEFTKSDFANYMKTLRGPYSQEEFAGILKTDTSVVYNWEAGESRPRPSFLRAAILHYKAWALQLELPMAARHANENRAQKKRLTTPNEPAKKALTYPEPES